MCKHVENEIVIYTAIFSNILYFNKQIYCTVLQATVQSHIKNPVQSCLKLKINDKGRPQFYNIFLHSRTQSHAQHLTCERAYSAPPHVFGAGYTPQD